MMAARWIAHSLVCANEMTLKDAQTCISSNWIIRYQKMDVTRTDEAPRNYALGSPLRTLAVPFLT
jgi:hypothetical protein